MKKMIAALLFFILFNTTEAQTKTSKKSNKSLVNLAQKERDVFYTLMAYAVVYSDWQNKAKGDSSRGYNIGCVLVNKENNVVYWALNSVNMLKKNKTQHGEVRLMQGFEELSKEATVKGYTIYTTLEPCCMCSGMMTLNQIYRTVYGQSDPEYGKALERLQLDSRACSNVRGYAPYPRAVIPNKSPDRISLSIDSAFTDYQKKGDNSITAFLSTNEVKIHYQKASLLFQNYQVRYPVNKAYLDSAKSYFKTIALSINQ